MDDASLQRKDFKKHRLAEQLRDRRMSFLETMDKDSLIQAIQYLLIKEPKLIRNVMAYIPEPTILSATNALLEMEKKLNNSFPFNKHGSGRDDYTFSRIREPLFDLADTLIHFINHFTSSRIFPTISFNFLDHAAHTVHRLPTWDTEENNALKENLYQQLNGFWKMTIQNASSKLCENETYNSDSINQWAKSLAQHNNFTGGYFTESVHEFTKQLGFLIGSSAEDKTAPVCHLAPLEIPFASTSVVGDRK